MNDQTSQELARQVSEWVERVRSTVGKRPESLMYATAYILTDMVNNGHRISQEVVRQALLDAGYPSALG